MSPVIVLIVLSLILFLGLSIASLGLSAVAFSKHSAHANGSQLTNLNASNLIAGTLSVENMPVETLFLQTSKASLNQLGFHEISLGQEHSLWTGEWNVAHAQSARVIVEEDVLFPVPSNMLPGFRYTLTVVIPVHGPTLTFVGEAFRGQSSIEFSSTVSLTKSGNLVNVHVYPFGSAILSLNPAHWYTMRLGNAYVAVDDKVSSWTDFGYAGTNLIMDDVLSQPTFIGNALHGVAGLLFNGSALLNTTSTMGSFVLVPQSGQSGKTTVFVAVKYLGSGSLLWNIESGHAGTNPMMEFPSSASVRYASFPSTQVQATISDLQNTVKVFTVRDSSNGIIPPEMFSNGVLIAPTVEIEGTSSVGDIAAELHLGGTAFEGIISELIFFPRFLSEEEMQIVWDEMLPAYGVGP